MPASTCVKCGSSSFEVQVAEPNGSRFRVTFVQCASCGGVVGVLDYMNIGNEVNQLGNKIQEIERKVNDIQNTSRNWRSG